MSVEARVTYAEARVACVERYGEPTDAYAVSACARMWWGRNGSGVDGVMLAELHTGGVELLARQGNTTRWWTLVGPGAVTPLPDALDAADEFLRTLARPTEGTT